MPIYEFKCQRCHHNFEELTLKEKEISCPNCRSKNVKKILSTFVSKRGGINQGGCSSCSGDAYSRSS